MTSVSRPQAQRSRLAILDAVTRLIRDEGAASVTHQRVAEEAGVGRATVYRHWPQLVDLLTAALQRTSLSFLEPASGTFRHRTSTDLHRMARELNAPHLTSMAATIVERAQFDEASRRLRDRLVNEITDNITIAALDAVATGELRAAPPADDLLAELIGPLWVCRMLQNRLITEAFVERVVYQALDPWLTNGSDGHEGGNVVTS
ncbi:MAG: TetR/AcrR family transcriptional regulator [Aquihabitans sp.]